MEKIWILFLFLVFTIGCQTARNNSEDKQLSEIAALEKEILKEGDASQKKETALLLVEKTIQYAEEYPDNEKTPDLLFKAADIARGAQDYGKAVMLWGRLWRNYPNHPKAPMALFLQGFTFDSNVGDARMAEKYYKDFLQQYPGDSLAVQVKQLLSVVDIKPEDLIRQFEEKN